MASNTLLSLNKLFTKILDTMETFTIVTEHGTMHYDTNDEKFYNDSWERTNDEKYYLEMLILNNPEKFEGCKIENNVDFTYKLITGNGVNEMQIHHVLKNSLIFDNIGDAEKAYLKEVESLKEAYTSQDDVNYSIDDVNESDKVYTRIELLEAGECAIDSINEAIQTEGVRINEEFQSEFFIL